MQLSLHFNSAEFERDRCSMPGGAAMAYRQLCETLLEPLRAEFAEPFVITSGYRSPEINAEIGGAPSSQHIATAEYCAADGYFVSHRRSMQPVFDWLRMKSGLAFDQLILEHGKYGDVIHISWSRRPRRMALEGATFNQSAYQARYVAPVVPGAAALDT